MSGTGAFIPFVVVVYLLALAWVTCHYSHTLLMWTLITRILLSLYHLINATRRVHPGEGCCHSNRLWPTVITMTSEMTALLLTMKTMKNYSADLSLEVRFIIHCEIHSSFHISYVVRKRVRNEKLKTWVLVNLLFLFFFKQTICSLFPVVTMICGGMNALHATYLHNNSKYTKAAISYHLGNKKCLNSWQFYQVVS